MSTARQIGPVEVSVQDTGVVLRFCDPMEMALEVPSYLSEQLKDFMDSHPEAFAGRLAVFDLEAAPAINSRQLGVLLTAQRALAGGGRLPLRGASRSIRRLLAMTKMDQFFELL